MATKKNQTQTLSPPSPPPLPPPTLGIRTSFHSLLAILITILIISVVYLTQNGDQVLEDCAKTNKSKLITKPLLSLGVQPQLDYSNKGCNLFDGKWVMDNESYPLYTEKQCSFMSDQLACEKFGREDLSFRNWRWQPRHCDLPRLLTLYIAFCSFSFNNFLQNELRLQTLDTLLKILDIWEAPRVLE